MSKTTLCFNATVKVKLTVKALEFLKEEHEEFWEAQINRATDSEFRIKILEEFKDKYQIPSTDEEGFSSFMLWDFMNKFGKLFHLGFNTTNYFLETYLES